MQNLCVCVCVCGGGGGGVLDMCPKIHSFYPASRAFLSGKSFCMYNVFRVSCFSRCLACLRPRDANDIVHAKVLARKKRSVSSYIHSSHVVPYNLDTNLY